MFSLRDQSKSDARRKPNEPPIPSKGESIYFALLRKDRHLASGATASWLATFELSTLKQLKFITLHQAGWFQPRANSSPSGRSVPRGRAPAPLSPDLVVEKAAEL